MKCYRQLGKEDDEDEIMMGMDEEEDDEEEKQVSLSEQKVSSRFILASILHKG